MTLITRRSINLVAVVRIATKVAAALAHATAVLIQINQQLRGRGINAAPLKFSIFHV